MRSESEVQVPKYGFLGNSGCKVGITNDSREDGVALATPRSSGRHHGYFRDGCDWTHRLQCNAAGRAFGGTAWLMCCLESEREPVH